MVTVALPSFLPSTPSRFLPLSISTVIFHFPLLSHRETKVNASHAAARKDRKMSLMALAHRQNRTTGSNVPIEMFITVANHPADPRKEEPAVPHTITRNRLSNIILTAMAATTRNASRLSKRSYRSSNRYFERKRLIADGNTFPRAKNKSRRKH